jgi:hypothetical protein
VCDHERGSLYLGCNVVEIDRTDSNVVRVTAVTPTGQLEVVVVVVVVVVVIVIVIVVVCFSLELS